MIKLDEQTVKVMAALAAPFDPEDVKWLPKAVSGNRAMALPYVDARVVMDRLDDVLGVGGWHTSHQVTPDGVICKLAYRIGGEWHTQEDVGSMSEQPDSGDRLKAAFSDAVKRVAVRIGVGRYLYRIKSQWVDYDQQKRTFTMQPQLPGWARPKPALPREVQDWVDWFDQGPTLEQFNSKMPVIGQIQADLKQQVWDLVKEHAQERGWQFDSTNKRWVYQQEEGAA